MQNNTNSHSFFVTVCKLFDVLAPAFLLWFAAGRTAQSAPLVVYVSFFALWHISLLGTGLYRLATQRSPLLYSIRVTASVIVAFAAVNLLAIPLRLSHISAIWNLRSWLLASLIILASRILLFPVLHRFGTGAGARRNVLVVGTNQRALAYAHLLRNRPELGFNVVGFVDQGWAGSHAVQAAGFRVVTDLDSFLDYLRRNVVDEVIICLPLQSQYARALEVAAISAEQGIATRILGNVFDLGTRVTKREFFDSPELITIAPAPRTPHMGVSVKRVFDFTVSLLLLIVIAPVFALTALAIRLTSKGPVFFKQERLGLNKRPFRMIKFRTMQPDAEARQKEIEQLNETGGPAFKLRNDPRITRVGAILRKLSIDELPQLINVLAGQMSLVGPRPLPVRDCEKFSEDWQRRRFSVRPGISCLWQVSGRSTIAFQQWMELDMEYIDRWSFWLDLNILARTIPAVLTGQGAY
ncbi:MAG TPA: sugar transferase [Bryobacteraceae bacterium]|jgi:exopolysaccharide biosynthesis polyprenyl glycosylphosphotransferase|nr:sugar transferase [Bryobacteraceae bacterium]